MASLEQQLDIITSNEVPINMPGTRTTGKAPRRQNVPAHISTRHRVILVCSPSPSELGTLAAVPMFGAPSKSAYFIICIVPPSPSPDNSSKLKFSRLATAVY
ncbi:hypothetical protein Bbelb_124790 [Branchiostoma belcheri]|nr:hypothetical protein Bbelb_124790 [Branchiostoma belcheri]